MGHTALRAPDYCCYSVPRQTPHPKTLSLVLNIAAAYRVAMALVFLLVRPLVFLG